MTRINVIDPKLLTDQHAMAEYRELPMVNASLKRTINSKRGLQRNLIPAEYTLNKGHVTFHYDKGLYLFNRYQSLVDELRNRGYNVQPSERSVDWNVFQAYPGLYCDWTPDQRAIDTNVDRIVERINAKPHWYRYYGKPIASDFIDKYLKNIRGQRFVPL